MEKELNKIQIGSRIKEIRLSKNETMEELADVVGSNKSNVSRWERGLNIPNEATLRKIAKHGEVSVYELLYGEINQYISQVLHFELHERNELFESLKTYFLLTGKEINKISDLKGDPIFVQNNYVPFLQEHINSIIDYIKKHSLFVNDEQLYEDPYLIVQLAISYIDNLAYEEKNIVYYGDDYKLTILETTQIEDVQEDETQDIYTLHGNALLEKTDFLKSGEHIELDYYSNFYIALYISKDNGENKYSFVGYESLEKKPYEEIFEAYTYEEVKKGLVEKALNLIDLKPYELNFDELEELPMELE